MGSLSLQAIQAEPPDGESKHWLVLVRASKYDSSVDAIWNPWALAYLKRLIKKFRPDMEILEVEVTQRHDDGIGVREQLIYEQISDAIGESGLMEAMVFVGHGSEWTFGIPGTNFNWDGEEAANFFKEIPSNIQLTDEFLIYFWSCSGFSREYEDAPDENPLMKGFEYELASYLLPMVGGHSLGLFEERRLKEINLVGHQGTAGFADWLPDTPLDAIYSPLKPESISAEQIKSKIVRKFGLAGLVNYAATLTTAFVAPELVPWTLLIFPAGGTALNLHYLGKLHMISKQARHLVVNKTGVFKDRDITAHKGLKRGLSQERQCVEQMQQLIKTNPASNF